MNSPQTAIHVPAGPPAGPRVKRLEGAPPVLEVRDVHKTFRVPEHRIDTFKERAVHPLTRPTFRELEALKGISFDVRAGEFFGIVGRNGSGKSTLLKVLASIYAADAGSIRMAGRLAPFIELGVGFNPDLSARENVVLNAVMMGLTPKQARARMDAVFEFAELEDFTEMRLKNYSSGMSVRLAFSVMLQADADIYLIDEVLAVGDASFQQKCTDVFHEMRDSDKTVILVTHDMTAVQTYCDRAMLLHDGEQVHVGDPELIGRRYFQLNFEGPEKGHPADVGNVSVDMHASIVDACIRDPGDERTTNVEYGSPIRFEAEIEAREQLVNPTFVFQCTNADSIQVLGFSRTLTLEADEENVLNAGERVRVVATIENRLAPGRFYLTCWVTRDRSPGDMALQALPLLDFVVFGAGPDAGGIIRGDGEVEVRRMEPGA